MITKRFLSLLCGFASLLGLNACDHFDLQALKPGISTAVEVRDRLGTPDMEWRNTDGSVVWEFSRQPEGTQCFMITIGPDDILRTVDQVLTDSHFSLIRPGMRTDEVRRILGKPASKQTFDLSKETVWQWRIASEPPITERLYFTVSFDTEGRVLRTGRNVEYRGG